MDRHPQQFKRERQDIKRRAKNITDMSKLRTVISNVLKTSELEEAQKIYPQAVSIIDKAASNGLIKKNTAARRKSTITKHLNSLA